MSDAAGRDTVFRGGRVWTGAGGGHGTDALAVRNGRVLAVGGEAQVRAAVGAGARTVDLEGGALLPGFVDSHTHFLLGGFELSGVHLRDASTPDAFVRRIADFAATLQPGQWITGGDWDHERWGGELPRREWIDAVTPANPVFVSRTDRHMGLANGLALGAAGVDEASADPPGGQVVRDPATGRPTGILKDMAMEYVSRVVPEPSGHRVDQALLAATRHAHALGVTQVHDMGPLLGGAWLHLEAYRRAHARGELGVRVYAAVALETWERMQAFTRAHGRGDDRLWWGGVKGFVDGSLGSTTAWFHEPYADAPESTGLTVIGPPVLRERILAADAAGLDVIVHAIGDRANDWLLDVYAEVARTNVGRARPRRLRTEHAQHLTPGAIERFARQGVVASMQPHHAIDDAPWAEKRIGAERVRRAYAFRSLLDTGATLAFGSDWTVAPLDPLPAVAAAVTRRAPGGPPRGWVPEQRITVEEALVAHTRGAAYAGFREDVTGHLVPGAYADLVVLSGDPFETPPEGLASLRVEATYVEGVEVYRR